MVGSSRKDDGEGQAAFRAGQILARIVGGNGSPLVTRGAIGDDRHRGSGKRRGARFPLRDVGGRRQRREPVSAARWSLGPRTAGGFGLAVKLLVEDKSLPQATLESLAREAHEKICPYSHATRNNVDVVLTIAGG